MSLFRKNTALENGDGETSSIFTPYLSLQSNVFAENKILRFLFIAILAVCLMNTYSIQKISDERATIVMPVGTSIAYSFVGGTPNDDYLRDMYLYVISLATSYSAANIDQKLVILKTLWSQSSYGKYDPIFKKNSEDIKRFPQISYQTIWDGSKPLRIEGKSIIGTFIKKKIVSTKVAATTTLQYKLNYMVNAGRFEVIDIKEIGGEQI